MQTGTPPGTARVAAALAAALPLALAAAQPAADPLGPLPPSAAPFREDLALLAVYVSEEAALRAAQVEAARGEVEEALWGLSLALEASPEAVYELDLAKGEGGWDAGFEVELALGLMRDEGRLVRARAALSTAEGRYRDQLRDDMRAGLLALSQERLDARALADAEAAAAEAADALAAARAAGGTPAQLASLEVAAGLADVELERLRLRYRPRDALLAEFGAAGTGRGPGDYLLGPLPPALSPAAPHAEAAALALDLERAELAVRALPFQHLREVEVTASYRDGGVQVAAELGLRRGVPAAEAQLGWSSGGATRRLSLGLSANVLFSNDSSGRPSLVMAERELARAALAEFAAAQPAREREALALVELAYEELRLLLLARDAAVAELEAARAEGRDTTRLEAGARRAEDAAERAWQRYVRALFDYLETTDAVVVGAADPTVGDER